MPDHCPYPSLPSPSGYPTIDGPAEPCNYLTNRKARFRYTRAPEAPDEYQALMDSGFRRAGRLAYQPICPHCRDCLPLRVPVGRFQPSKSQRRVWRRNADLRVDIAAPQVDQESYGLYCEYLLGRHDGSMSPDPEAFVDFLHEGGVAPLEFRYRDSAGRLIAVGMCDRTPVALSSVYFYFDPREARRSPGVFGVLAEIDYCARNGLQWYYLGYWVKHCRTMHYKADYRPHQVLSPEGLWVEVALG